MKCVKSTPLIVNLSTERSRKMDNELWAATHQCEYCGKQADIKTVKILYGQTRKSTWHCPHCKRDFITLAEITTDGGTECVK